MIVTIDEGKLFHDLDGVFLSRCCLRRQTGAPSCANCDDVIMAKRGAKNWIVDRWLIESMEQWDRKL
jgi:hypothetical protein